MNTRRVHKILIGSNKYSTGAQNTRHVQLILISYNKYSSCELNTRHVQLILISYNKYSFYTINTRHVHNILIGWTKYSWFFAIYFLCVSPAIYIFVFFSQSTFCVFQPQTIFGVCFFQSTFRVRSIIYCCLCVSFLVCSLWFRNCFCDYQCVCLVFGAV